MQSRRNPALIVTAAKRLTCALLKPLPRGSQWFPAVAYVAIGAPYRGGVL